MTEIPEHLRIRQERAKLALKKAEHELFLANQAVDKWNEAQFRTQYGIQDGDKVFLTEAIKQIIGEPIHGHVRRCEVGEILEVEEVSPKSGVWLVGEYGLVVFVSIEVYQIARRAYLIAYGNREGKP